METQAAIAAAVAGFPLAHEAKQLIEKFLGPAFGEVGELFADRVRKYRLKNQVRTLRAAEQILAQEGLSPKAVNLKIFVPLLEAAALEEDQDMAARWAKLLATAADPRRPADIEPSFIEVLKQLSPTQAKILEVIYTHVETQDIPCEDWHRRGVNSDGLLAPIHTPETEFRIAVDNLVRLGLLSFAATFMDFLNNKDAKFQLANRELLCATFFGRAFFAACNGGTTKAETTGVTSSTAQITTTRVSVKFQQSQ